MAVPWLVWVGREACILAYLGDEGLYPCSGSLSVTRIWYRLSLYPRWEPLVLEFPGSSLVQMRAAMKSCDGKDCGPEAPSFSSFLPNRIPPSWP